MLSEPTDEEFLARAVSLALDNAIRGQLPFGGAARIIYAAPKEQVPDLGVPFPQRVAEMQAVWRRTGSDPIAYVPTPGADEPFARFVANAGSGR